MDITILTSPNFLSSSGTVKACIIILTCYQIKAYHSIKNCVHHWFCISVIMKLEVENPKIKTL